MHPLLKRRAKNRLLTTYSWHPNLAPSYPNYCASNKEVSFKSKSIGWRTWVEIAHFYRSAACDWALATCSPCGPSRVELFSRYGRRRRPAIAAASPSGRLLIATAPRQIFIRRWIDLSENWGSVSRKSRERSGASRRLRGSLPRSPRAYRPFVRPSADASADQIVRFATPRNSYNHRDRQVNTTWVSPSHLSLQSFTPKQRRRALGHLPKIVTGDPSRSSFAVDLYRYREDWSSFSSRTLNATCVLFLVVQHRFV